MLTRPSQQQQEHTAPVDTATELLEAQNETAEDYYTSALIKSWQYRQDDVNKLLTLIQSHSNIFMHGCNGCGKTTFVQMCFNYKRRDAPCIYVDTTEFYSEKLIAISISCQLESTMQSFVQTYRLPKLFKRKFTFKVCKSFAALQEALQVTQENMEQLKQANEDKYPQLRDFNFFFYVVLDNVKGIMRIER